MGGASTVKSIATPIDIVARVDAARQAGIVISAARRYADVLRGCESMDYQSAKSTLGGKLSSLWCSEYLQAVAGDPEVIEFTDDAYRFLFDYRNERVVAAFGETRPTADQRDKARESGFVPNFTKFHPDRDRGHFMSHASGGLMDVNFFPQKKEVNRGWSPAGKVYRAMEKYCASSPGTFVFSRPIYKVGDTGWDPEQLEYGFYNQTRDFRSVVFPNR
jgi:hypothetical protein